MTRSSHSLLDSSANDSIARAGDKFQSYLLDSGVSRPQRQNWLLYRMQKGPPSHWMESLYPKSHFMKTSGIRPAAYSPRDSRAAFAAACSASFLLWPRAVLEPPRFIQAPRKRRLEQAALSFMRFEVLRAHRQTPAPCAGQPWRASSPERPRVVPKAALSHGGKSDGTVTASLRTQRIPVWKHTGDGTGEVSRPASEPEQPEPAKEVTE